MGSAHRAGWFRGSYKCGLSATPFGGFATTFAPVGSVSLDSQSPAAPYESSSLATPQAVGQQSSAKL